MSFGDNSHFFVSSRRFGSDDELSYKLSQITNHFINTPHINSKGEIIVHGIIQGFSLIYLHDRLERVDDNYFKVIGIPPALQVMGINSNVTARTYLVVLLQDRNLMFIDQAHPEGIILKTPSIQRLYYLMDRIYLLDIHGNFYRLKSIKREADHEKAVSLLEQSCENPLYSDIVMVSVGNNILFSSGVLMILLNRDNQLILLNKKVQRLSIIQLDRPVRSIVENIVLFCDGVISRLDIRISAMHSRSGHLIDLFKCEGIKDLTVENHHIFVLDENNQTIKYERERDGSYEEIKLPGIYSRFIRLGRNHISLREDLHGELHLTDHQSKISFPYRLINFTTVEKRNQRLRKTKIPLH